MRRFVFTFLLSALLAFSQLPAGKTVVGFYALGSASLTTANALPVVASAGTLGQSDVSLASGVFSRAGTLGLSATGANSVTIATDGTTRVTISSAGLTTLQGQLELANNNGVVLQNVGGGAAASLYRDPSDDLILRNATSNKAIYFRAGGDTNLGSLAAAGAWTFYNATATTGVTQVVVRAGAGQSTNAVVNVVANDGTTSVFKLESAKVGFFGVAPVARQTATADAASILALLQAYGLSN